MPGDERESRLFYITERTTGTRFLVDTGAEISVFPASAKDRLSPTWFMLRAANKTDIKTFGEKSLTLDLGLRRVYRWIFVKADVSLPILGADFLGQFSLAVDVKHRRLIDLETTLSVSGIRSSLESLSLTFGISEEQSVYHDLLRQYPNITRPAHKDTPLKHDITHHIVTKGPPVYARPRRLAPDRLRIAKAEFDHMLELGIIRPSQSSWSSPLHMVKKIW